MLRASPQVAVDINMVVEQAYVAVFDREVEL